MRKLLLILAFLFLGTLTAQADTLTVFPDAGSGATTVDGDIGTNGLATWAAARDAATGTSASTSATTTNLIRNRQLSSSSWWVTRGFFLFDTSSLTSGATITAGVISFTGTGGAENDADGIDIDIVSSSPASDNNLTTADFDQIGSTVFASIALNTWNQTDNVYNDFTLDANGRTNISKTGISKFATRGSYDTDDIPPTALNNVETRYADTSGTTSDPKLVVTFTPPTPTDGNFFQLF